MAADYLEGNAIRVRAWRSDGEAVVDASTWRLLSAGPGDLASVETAMAAEAGKAVGAFTPDRAGWWRYRVEASGTAAIERVINVRPRVVPDPAP